MPVLRTEGSLIGLVQLVVLAGLLTSIAVGQTSSPTSDPQASALASGAIAALTGGQTVQDVTLTGSVVWAAGTGTGTANLQALGTGESRMDLTLDSGTRTEIRDSQTGMQLGQWINPDSTSGYFAPQNCWTDATWFFPVLGSLAGEQNVVFSYIGPEIFNGASVQHIQSYLYVADPSQSATVQQLSAQDFYLDATTQLPIAIVYNVHPDNDATTNISVEVDFSNYQAIGGVAIPMRIQRYQQGTLIVDLTLSGASFNTGLALSTFAIN